MLPLCHRGPLALHVGNIQIQMEIFLSCFTKGNLCDDSVTDINPNFPRTCPGIEIHIVTSAFETYFLCLDYMFPELVTFPSSAELIQDLF